MLDYHFDIVVNKINCKAPEAELSNWMLSNLKVFNKKFSISDSIYVEIKDDDSEENDVEYVKMNTELQQLYEEAEKDYIQDADEEDRILKMITKDMLTTHKKVWNIFDRITAKMGNSGLFGGADGTPGDSSIMFFIAHVMDKCGKGAVGVDFGHGTGGTALSFACCGCFRMLGFEVITFLWLFHTTISNSNY